MKTQVFVCNTLFHLFVSIVYYLKRDPNEQYFFILSNDINDIDSIKGKLYSNLEIENTVIADEKSLRKILSKNKTSVFKYKKIIRKSLDQSLSIISRRMDLQFFLFNDCTPSSRYFLYNFSKADFTLLEEGAFIYLTKAPNQFTRIKTQLIYGIQKFGRDKRIKEIRVASPHKVGADIQKKTKHWDLPQKIDQLTTEEKDLILSIFISDFSFIYKEYDAILITQPLSEDKFFNEEKKISLYKKIYELYELNEKKILIKTHPREITNYRAFFPDATIITEQFPLEILNFFPDFQIELGLTIFSSAIHNISFVKKKVELGISYFKELETAYRSKL